MRRRSTLPVVVLLAAGSLAGCSGGSSSGSQSSSSPSSQSPSSTHSASPSAGSSSASPSGSPSTASPGSAGGPGFPHDRTEATSMHKAVLVRSAAKTPDERAAVDAWMAYWQGAADTYYYYRPTQQFTAAASGAARSSVLRYMQGNKAQKQRVVGWARDNVLAVSVSGDTAKIHDCTENYTFTVDQEAEPLTQPPPFYDTTGTLRKVDGRWVVVHQDSHQKKQSCLG